jgi:hypothetical protein
MATGSVIKLGSLYVKNVIQARPTNPWNPNSEPITGKGVGNIPLYANGNIEIRDTPSEDANKIQWIEVNDGNTKLLICDRNILSKVSWSVLNTQNLVTGKTVTIDGRLYNLRLLTGGEVYDDTSNEWYKYIQNNAALSGLPTPNNEDANNSIVDADFISAHNARWNWVGEYTLCQEISPTNAQLRTLRGYYGTGYFYTNSFVNATMLDGFRPVLEVLNNAPQISDSDRALGNKDASFTLPYTVSEVDGENFQILEKVDNTQIRSLTNQSAGSFTLDLSSVWSGLALGAHTLTITATDPQNASAVRTFTFTKTNTAPPAPSVSGLANGLRIPVSGFVEFTPGTDVEGDTQTVSLQFASDSGFTSNVQEFSANLERWDGTDWDSEIDVPDANAGTLHRLPYSGLALNTTRYLRVKTTDGYNTTYSAVYTLKVNDTLTVQTTKYNYAAMPQYIAVMLQAVLSAGATVTEVLVCNNANDASPTWEDATAAYLAGNEGHYAFTNTTKTDANWATQAKITVNAGTATGEISITKVARGSI